MWEGRTGRPWLPDVRFAEVGPGAILHAMTCPRLRLSIVCLALSACDSSEPSNEEMAPTSVCESETRDDLYMVGMEKIGQSVAVRILDAAPAPPERFDNAWTIEVLDSKTMQPRTDTSLVVEPFMPDHKHGSSIECEVTPLETAGQYELDPINLFMPGLWEVRLRFTTPDAGEDQLVFKFCVEQ